MIDKITRMMGSTVECLINEANEWDVISVTNHGVVVLLANVDELVDPVENSESGLIKSEFLISSLRGSCRDRPMSSSRSSARQMTTLIHKSKNVKHFIICERQ